jgi:putative transcriptional regulator
LNNYSITTINLRVLRTRFNKTQKDISKLLNLSTVQYAKKENGKAEFSLKEAKLLSDTFKKSIDEIFFATDVY